MGAGDLVGALAGLWCYLFFTGNPDLSGYRIVRAVFGTEVDWALWAKSLAVLVSTFATLIATPVATLCFRRSEATPELESIYKAFAPSKDPTSADAEIEKEGFGLKPTSRRGKIGLLLMLIGFIGFLVGIVLGSVGHPLASEAAIGGMLVFFSGGLMRVYSD